MAAVGLNEATYVAVLSHDLKIDLPALEAALRSPARYVGALGSRKTHAKRIAALTESGFGAAEIDRIHSPIGARPRRRPASRGDRPVGDRRGRPGKPRSVTGAGYRGVVLAAGGSRRFGGPLAKQLVEIDGEPAVRRAARVALAARLERVAVVTGHAAGEVRRALAGLEVALVHNPAWREGQSGSVRAGLAAVAAEAAAVVFVACDQPFLTTATIDRLIARHAEGGAAIVAPSWRGRRGAPVLIDRALFPEIDGITGDAGARQLFARHPVAEVAVEDEAPLLDFDSPGDLRRLLAHR